MRKGENKSAIAFWGGRFESRIPIDVLRSREPDTDPKMQVQGNGGVPETLAQTAWPLMPWRTQQFCWTRARPLHVAAGVSRQELCSHCLYSSSSPNTTSEPLIFFQCADSMPRTSCSLWVMVSEHRTSPEGSKGCRAPSPRRSSAQECTASKAPWKGPVRDAGINGVGCHGKLRADRKPGTDPGWAAWCLFSGVPGLTGLLK